MMLTYKSFESFSTDLRDFSLNKSDSIESIKSAGTQLVKNLGFNEKSVEAWAQIESGFTRVASARKELTPGFYVATLTMIGPMLIPFSVSQDQILELPDQKTNEIINKGNEFFKLEETFKELNFLHKRGILLSGQVGTGKSVIAFKLGRNLVEKHGGVVIYPTSPYALISCAKDFRSVQPATKLMCVLEDIDEVCGCFGEKALTAFLDGEHQINNILTVATTNNPGALSKRLTARPSRFDIKETITVMTAEARRSFLDQKATTLSAEQKELWVEKTEDFTVPALKELMLLVLAYCYPLEDSVSKIRKNFVSSVPDV